MFSPNVEKLQEPLVLAPGHCLVVNFKPVKAPEGLDRATVTRRTVLLSKAVRWKAANGEVQVAFNHNAHPGPPIKYFQESAGEFLINDKMECVCFYAPPGGRPVTLFMEVM